MFGHLPLRLIDIQRLSLLCSDEESYLWTSLSPPSLLLPLCLGRQTEMTRLRSSLQSKPRSSRTRPSGRIGLSCPSCHPQTPTPPLLPTFLDSGPTPSSCPCTTSWVSCFSACISFQLPGAVGPVLGIQTAWSVATALDAILFSTKCPKLIVLYHVKGAGKIVVIFVSRPGNQKS